MNQTETKTVQFTDGGEIAKLLLRGEQFFQIEGGHGVAGNRGGVNAGAAVSAEYYPRIGFTQHPSAWVLRAGEKFPG